MLGNDAFTIGNSQFSLTPIFNVLLSVYAFPQSYIDGLAHWTCNRQSAFKKVVLGRDQRNFPARIRYADNGTMPTQNIPYNNVLVRQIKRFRPAVAVAKSTMRYVNLPIRPLLVSRYLKTHTVRKLQIGSHVCTLPGWLNTDLYPLSIGAVSLDATKTFPLPDASFDYVFSEHQLEHIDYSEALKMLSECRRILRPGGKIRLAVPSLDCLVELIRPSRTDLQERYIRYSTDFLWPSIQEPGPCFAFNSSFMHWGHKFIYDQATLRHTLETAGFAQVQFFKPGVSDDPNLTGIEIRVSEFDVYGTIVAQAVRA